MYVEAHNYGIHLATIAIIFLAILLVILWRKKQSISYVICCVLFATYLLILIDKTIFPIRISDIKPYGATNFMSGVNLIPFNFDLSFIPHMVKRQIFQNILLTVPFGFGICFIVKLKTRDFLWLIPAVGISIEATQLLISLLLGYPYRIIDINDALMNTLGVLVGYGIFRAFAWCYIGITNHFTIQHIGITKYVYDVVSQHTQEKHNLD